MAEVSSEGATNPESQLIKPLLNFGGLCREAILSHMSGCDVTPVNKSKKCQRILRCYRTRISIAWEWSLWIWNGNEYSQSRSGLKSHLILLWAKNTVSGLMLEAAEAVKISLTALARDQSGKSALYSVMGIQFHMEFYIFQFHSQSSFWADKFHMPIH